MHFDKICRICLGEGTLISIFGTQEQIGGRYISFTDMILACATVPVSYYILHVMNFIGDHGISILMVKNSNIK